MSASVTVDLKQWITEQGGGMAHADLSLTHELEGGGRGAVMASTCCSGTKLLAVPRQACIVSEPSADQDGSQDVIAWLKMQDPGLGPFLSTVLLLMWELGLGTASRLAPWLSQLPRSHDCLLSWSAEQMALLQGTEIEGADANYRDVFRSTVLPLIQQRGEWWPVDQRTFEAFQFAAGMVQSRSFHLNKTNWMTHEVSEEEQLFMLAGIDMVNHSSVAARRNATLDLAAASSAAQESPTAGSFILALDRDVAAGEEVLISYGDLSDAELLRIYGFVEGQGDNPHRSVSISAASVFETCQAAAEEANDLEQYQVAEAWVRSRVGNSFKLTHAELIPASLITSLMALTMPDKEFREFAQPPADDDGAKPDRLPTEVDMATFEASAAEDAEFCGGICECLLHLLALRRQRYPAQLPSSATDAETVRRRHMAEQVRSGQLAILSQASRWVVTLMARLDRGSDSGASEQAASSDDCDGSQSLSGDPAILPAATGEETGIAGTAGAAAAKTAGGAQSFPKRQLEGLQPGTASKGRKTVA